MPLPAAASFFCFSCIERSWRELHALRRDCDAAINTSTLTENSLIILPHRLRQAPLRPVGVCFQRLQVLMQAI